MSDFPVERSEAEWKSTLSEDQYRVLREHGTEPAFENAFWNNHAEGMYHCAGCGATLFTSVDKYDSGTGWPSYSKPADDKAIGTSEDRSWLQQRTEVHCKQCGGHLGHVFPDGPEPRGERYCINSAALRFEKE